MIWAIDDDRENNTLTAINLAHADEIEIRDSYVQGSPDDLIRLALVHLPGGHVLEFYREQAQAIERWLRGNAVTGG